jgi:hypothetical protein
MRFSSSWSERSSRRQSRELMQACWHQQAARCCVTVLEARPAGRGGRTRHAGCCASRRRGHDLDAEIFPAGIGRTVSEWVAGHAVGWPDQSGLARRFKAHYGLSATTYASASPLEPPIFTFRPQQPPDCLRGNRYRSRVRILPGALDQTADQRMHGQTDRGDSRCSPPPPCKVGSDHLGPGRGAQPGRRPIAPVITQCQEVKAGWVGAVWGVWPGGCWCVRVCGVW